MSYAGYPCKFCQRQRVEDEGDRHVCEKCRKDQETGEYVPEPDPLDDLIVATKTYVEGGKVIIREITAREFYQPGPINFTPPSTDKGQEE